MSDQLIRWCCVDRLSWNRFSEPGLVLIWVDFHFPRRAFLGTWSFQVVSMGPPIAANSLCRRRTRSTMHGTQVQSEDSGLVRFVPNPNIQRGCCETTRRKLFRHQRDLFVLM